jgi:hypothetical protein
VDAAGDPDLRNSARAALPFSSREVCGTLPDWLTSSRLLTQERNFSAGFGLLVSLEIGHR